MHLLRLVTQKETDAEEMKLLTEQEIFCYFKIDNMNWNILDDQKDTYQEINL